MDTNVDRKIAVLQEQFIELTRYIKGQQSLTINGFDGVHNDIKEIKEQLNIVEQKLNKLIGDVSVVNEQGKLKKDFRDYTDDEILAIRNKLSINKAANFLHCSKSTILRACKRALNKKSDIVDMAAPLEFDDDIFVDF